jgi:hypothetical protein
MEVGRIIQGTAVAIRGKNGAGRLCRCYRLVAIGYKSVAAAGKTSRNLIFWR